MILSFVPLVLSAVGFFVLLFGFAFTSVAEVLFSTQGRQLIRIRGDYGPSIHYILENPHRVSFAVQLSRQFSAVGAAVSAAYWWVIQSDTLPTQISTLDAVVSIGVVLGLIVLFADMIPKVLTAKYTTQTTNVMGSPVYWLTLAMLPLYWVSNRLMAKVCALAGVSPLEARKMITEDEIKKLVDHAQQEGILENSEKEMIQSIFHFSETVVREIMTPRTDSVCIDSRKTVLDAILVISESGHSRIPVYEGSVDTIVGFAYAKDLLSVSQDGKQTAIKEFLRPAVFIPETQSIEMLLHELKKGRTHLAIVVDEFGTTAGLVTLEDVIEEIVGEIQDEYDPIVRSQVVLVSPGRYSVAGGMNVTDFSEAVGVEIPESEDYDTVGGFVLHSCGKFPEKGEVIPYLTHSFRVEETGAQRINRLEFKKES